MTTRPLRADAARNRDRVLAAAEAVFAAKGSGAATEEVAREAGVGIGTVFRHFPTKEDLLEAVLLGLVDRLAAQAEEARGADDPGAAFFTFFTEVVGQAAAKNAVSDALAEAGVDPRAAAAPGARRLRRGLADLLVRAQEAGAVRRDAGLAEVMTLLLGASRSAGQTPAPLRARALEIVFDGLRRRPD